MRRRIVKLMECFFFKVNAGQEMNQRSNTAEMATAADASLKISCHVLTTPTTVLGRITLTGYTASKKVSSLYEVRAFIKTIIGMGSNKCGELEKVEVMHTLMNCFHFFFHTL